MLTVGLSIILHAFRLPGKTIMSLQFPILLKIEAVKNSKHHLLNTKRSHYIAILSTS